MGIQRHRLSSLKPDVVFFVGRAFDGRLFVECFSASRLKDIAIMEVMLQQFEVETPGWWRLLRDIDADTGLRSLVFPPNIEILQDIVSGWADLPADVLLALES